MIEEVKRAIDNNDVNKLYDCGLYVDSSIKEYILNKKKKIVDDILNLKLWLDDEIAQIYFNDNDFIKASILSSNVDVARLFDNIEINNFLNDNIYKIIGFINERIYFISDKTPKYLLNNVSFIHSCLDNGFLNILDYCDDDGYYLENKDKINRNCYDKIIKGIVKLDEFSSKRMLLNPDFLIGSIFGNNYNVLLFSNNSYLDKFISDNYNLLKDKLENFVRTNNYFVNKNIDIKLPFFLDFYKKLINKNINEFSFFFKLMDNNEFCYFLSFLEDDTILSFFGKKIYQLYSFFGISLFEIGYENISLINSFSIIEFERFVKIFCYSGTIKMENVRNMYFDILRDEFDKICKFNKNTAFLIEEMIDNEGILNDFVLEKISDLKRILGQSYYECLKNMIDSDKSFSEFTNDVFDAYRRASIALDDNKKIKYHDIILSLCNAAYEREFDLYASSKMNFNDGYPFFAEPSDIYIKRVYKDSKLKIIKEMYLNDKKKFDTLCMDLYDGNITYSSFVNDVKSYLKNGDCKIFDLNRSVDNYLSKYISSVDVDNVCISYYNLPLTDEYLKVNFNIKTVLSVLKNVNFGNLRLMLSDDYYVEFKDFLYDKQVLYMIDCFDMISSFYNIKNLSSLINNFNLLSGSICEKFNFAVEFDRAPSNFSSILGDAYNYIKNDSSIIRESFKRAYKCVKKNYLPVSDIEKKYMVNNHIITIKVGGYDYNDVFLPIVVNSDVFVSAKYDWLHNYVFTNNNGFIIKFYDNKLIGLVYGIRYGNCLFLSNLSYVVHSTYIIEPLKKFVLSLVDDMRSNGDNLGHVYLSNYGCNNKFFTMVNDLVNGLTDYSNNGLVLYDDLSKVNCNFNKKYSIKNSLYDDAYKRAYDLAVLDLFGNGDEFLINDIKIGNVKCAGRSWYKVDDLIVALDINDEIVDEISGLRK